MEILKKNVLSILCLVVTLLAVIATFFPLGRYFAKLQEGVDEIVDAGTQLQNLERKPRVIPGIGPNGTSMPLSPYYPTQQIHDWMLNNIRGELTAQANNLEAEAKTKSEDSHKLLTLNSLPDPVGSAPFDFKVDYANGLRHLREEIVKGCLPPTAQEIKDQIKLLRDQLDLTKITISGQVTNQKDVDEQFARESASLPLKMRIQRAQDPKYLMYVMPGALQVTEDALLEATKTTAPLPPTPQQIWLAQVGYWAAQDVCDAIKATNEAPREVTNETTHETTLQKPQNILQAPVKALVSLNLPVKMDLYVLPASREQGGGNRSDVVDPYLLVKPDAAHVPLYTISSTGRACNGLYDVIQFDLTVCMEPQYVQVFALNLSKNRFITIKEMNLSPFDVDDKTMGRANETGTTFGESNVVTGYYYGSNPKLVKVEFKCEELMLRSWTENSATGNLIPQTVAVSLGIGSKKP